MSPAERAPQNEARKTGDLISLDSVRCGRAGSSVRPGRSPHHLDPRQWGGDTNSGWVQPARRPVRFGHAEVDRMSRPLPVGGDRDQAWRSVSRPSAGPFVGVLLKALSEVIGSASRTVDAKFGDRRPPRPVLVTDRDGGTVRLAQAGFGSSVGSRLGRAAASGDPPRWFRPRACPIVLIEPARPAGARSSESPRLPLPRQRQRDTIPDWLACLVSGEPVAARPGSDAAAAELISARALFSVAGIGRACRHRPVERQHLRPFRPARLGSRHDRYRLSQTVAGGAGRACKKPPDIRPGALVAVTVAVTVAGSDRLRRAASSDRPACGSVRPAARCRTACGTSR